MPHELGFSCPPVIQPYIPKPFKPAQYIACRTVDNISIDGALTESSWANAAWTPTFGHIFMTGYPKPFLATRAKLIWDDQYLYAGVELEEPNLIGHVVTKDEEIYNDNDIELFIDVDDDGQDYIELEFNCLGTIWDMFLPKEYNRGGFPHSHPRVEGSPPWDLEGMLVAVRMDGSLNYPHDVDTGWTVEMALPWDSLQKTSRKRELLNRRGTMMRLNFSRVQHNWPKVWPIIDWKNWGDTVYDWTWSQCLVYNMHSCESWGRVILSDQTVIQLPDIDLEEPYKFLQPPQSVHTLQPGCMVKISGGTYTIGPDPTNAVDSPQGSVALDEFYIDRYLVTIGEYTDFLNAGGHDKFYGPDMANPDFCGIIKYSSGYQTIPGRAFFPVTLITREGAQAYAAWSGKRLPTEYEWEAAARGLEARLYPWGNDPVDTDRANFDYRIGHTTPVGTYEAGRTPEGLYDMAGNVWELCDGHWTPYAWAGLTADVHTSGRIMRGGSWVTPAANMTVTYRNAEKGGIAAMVGFRCVRDGC